MKKNYLRKPMEMQLQSLPENVRFCTRCVNSNQRPRIGFDEEGVCSACNYADTKRTQIDWIARKDELEETCDKYRRNDGWWDILVPGSGGKDSAFVAHLLKEEYGMNPLCVTWAPFQYTEIGRDNFHSFVDSGFTTITGYANGTVHRKLARLAFEEVGDNFLPFIWGQHSFVYHMALRYDINLIFYGEHGE